MKRNRRGKTAITEMYDLKLVVLNVIGTESGRWGALHTLKVSPPKFVISNPSPLITKTRYLLFFVPFSSASGFSALPFFNF